MTETTVAQCGVAIKLSRNLQPAATSTIAETALMNAILREVRRDGARRRRSARRRDSHERSLHASPLDHVGGATRRLNVVG